MAPISESSAGFSGQQSGAAAPASWPGSGSATPSLAKALQASGKLMTRGLPAGVEKNLSEFRQGVGELYQASTQGEDVFNAAAKKQGFVVKPPIGAAFALNMVFHMLVLFTALTMLYKFVISPMEVKALNGEVSSRVGEMVQSAYEGASLRERTVTYSALQQALPLLQRLEASYAGPDPVRQAHNEGVMSLAYGIIAIIAVVFVVTVGVLVKTGAGMAKPVAHIVFENLVLFSVVGVVEYMFFMHVGAKYVPVLPSQFAQNALAAIKTQFPLPAGSSSA